MVREMRLPSGLKETLQAEAKNPLRSRLPFLFKTNGIESVKTLYL